MRRLGDAGRNAENGRKPCVTCASLADEMDLKIKGRQGRRALNARIALSSSLDADMAHAKAHIGTTNYAVSITVGHHQLSADESRRAASARKARSRAC
jgi:hypothetical protein